MRSLVLSLLTVCVDWDRKEIGCLERMVFSIIRAISSRWPRPTTASMPFAWLNSSAPNLCGRQPATITFFTLPSCLQLTACFIASSASALAGSIKPQVLTTTTSACHASGGSGWAVISKPALAISANILSLSTMFLGQPRAIKPTVVDFWCFFFLIV